MQRAYFDQQISLLILIIRKENIDHLLNRLGKLAFKLRRFVTTDGEGRSLKRVADLNAAFSSSPSTGFLRSVNFKGFSIYLGNFSKVQEKPDLAGLAGLKATSYSIAGFGSPFVGRAGIGTSSPYTSFILLNPPQVLARCEKGFSCSFFLLSSSSLRACF